MRHPIPPRRFGKDHWSTFAYVECRVVDNGGVPNRQHMRCDPRIHPGLTNSANREFGGSRRYPTRLRDGVATRHDDWSCVDDLAAAGLVEILGTGIHPVWRLTDRGREVAAKLRAHKSAGKNFASFVWVPRAWTWPKQVTA